MCFPHLKPAKLPHARFACHREVRLSIPSGSPLFFFDSASIEYAHVLIALYSFFTVKKEKKRKKQEGKEEVEEKGETVSREERILSIRSRGAISM